MYRYCARAVTFAVAYGFEKMVLAHQWFVRSAFDGYAQVALVGSAPATVSIAHQASVMSSPPRQADQWSKSAAEP